MIQYISPLVELFGLNYLFFVLAENDLVDFGHFPDQTEVAYLLRFYSDCRQDRRHLPDDLVELMTPTSPTY